MGIDETNHIYIAMPMYNLIEYSDNYSDIRKFMADTVDNSQSFKYKAALV